MIRFNSDYTEGAHPLILQRLLETNMEQSTGYGEDPYCAAARECICALCKNSKADVHFLVGGTQANLTIISAALRPHQSVMSPYTGHIAIHEAGAIEATGHKVETFPSDDGKITAEQIKNHLLQHYADESHEHITQPKMVYISNPTEIGTIYSQSELKAIRKVCDEFKLLLFMDGARLGYGFAAAENDLDLPFLAQVCDAFYIGGTKVGALFGEAVVLTHPQLKENFRYIMKQKGGMLAKGRLLGIQFLTLLENGLYFDIAKEAVEKAIFLRDEIKKAGFDFLIDSPTNQQFPIFPNTLIAEIKKEFSFATWQTIDENSTAVRFCTSWATTWDAVQKLIDAINAQRLKQ